MKTVILTSANLKEAIMLEEKINKVSFSSLDSNQLSFVLIDNEKVIGVIDYKIALDECDILYYCIDNEYRGKGLSKLLFNDSVEYLKNKNIKSIFLEVSDKNIIAYNLYKNLEFKEISIRKNYYSDNSDAIVMNKIIC